MNRAYSLRQVRQVYSAWGRSPLFYRMGVWSFGFDSHIRKKAVERLDLKPGTKVLDLACGPGITFKYLEDKIGPRGQIIALDYVQEMIAGAKKLARRKGWKNIKFLRQDAATMKLTESSVDGIICTLGMSAIPDHVAALKKCRNTLKKGAKLVIVDGKDFNYKFLNPIIKLLRWEKTYERKDILKDLKAIFSDLEVEEYLLGSTFISVAKK